MVKYEFMGAHGRGSENKGAAKHKVGGGCEKKEGCKKNVVYAPPRLCTPMRTYSD